MIDATRPLRPVPAPSLRPWAGDRLGGHGGGVGELWLAAPGSLVGLEAHGVADGSAITLDAVAGAAGAPFVGERAMRLLGPRFPLIVKLIDAADWLSLQVHPDDALAVELYGTGAVGKSEAWVVLDADPGAELVTGPDRDLSEGELRSGISAGTLGRSACEARPAIPGEVLLLAAGTMHAIGAGTFVYEIEQPSDITFRISDWGRPAAPGRPLHRAEALRAIRPRQHAEPAGGGWQIDGGVLATPEFRLELLTLDGRGEELTRRPSGGSLEVLTVLAGTVDVIGKGWTEVLGRYETLVVPASSAAYRIEGRGGSRVAVGSVG